MSKMSGFLGLFVGLALVGVAVAASAKFDQLFQPSWALDHFIYEGDLLKLKLDNYSGTGFGSKSKYMFGKVTIQLKLDEVPSWLTNLTHKIYEESGLFPSAINHVLINEYLPNQGIMPHQDGPAYFPVVAILSLGSPVVMDFTPHARLKMDPQDAIDKDSDGGTFEVGKDKWLDDHHQFLRCHRTVQITTSLIEFLGNTTGEPYSVQTNVYVNGVGNREQRLDLWFDPTKDFHSYSISWNQRQVV